MTQNVVVKRNMLLILAAIVLSAGVAPSAHPEIRDLTPPVRMVLSRVGPLMEKKEYARAADMIQAFLKRGGPPPAPGKRDPKGYHHSEVYFALGNCYLLQNQYAPAAGAYAGAVDRDPGHTFAWLNMAKAHYELEQYEKSARAFLQGYETAEEKKGDHLYFAAAAFLMAGNNKAAIRQFERLIQKHPAAVKPEYKEHYVHALLADNRPRRALPVIRELADLYTGKKKIQWLEILLHQYLQLKMNGEALNLAKELTRQWPGEARWWKALAHIHLDGERSEDALAALIIYSFLTPMTPEEKRLVADLHLQYQIPAKAAPLYEDCLDTKPDEQVALRLIQAYRQMGQLEKAMEALDRLGPDSKNPEQIMLKGDLLYALKQYGDAGRQFLRAARIKGAHAGRAWLMAGYAAWRMNDVPAGKKAFTEASRFRFEKKAASRALKQLARISTP